MPESIEQKKAWEIAEGYREKHFPAADYPNIQIQKVWREMESNTLCIRYESAFGRPVGWWHYMDTKDGLTWW